MLKDSWIGSSLTPGDPVKWHVVSLSDVMIIAIPIWQGRISPVLDTATRLHVLTCRDGKEIGRREVLLGELEPEELARSIAELHLDLLLCAALSQALHRALCQHGVRVRPHLCGEIEAVLRAYCHHRLGAAEFRMPGSSGSRFDTICSAVAGPPSRRKSPARTPPGIVTSQRLK